MLSPQVLCIDTLRYALICENGYMSCLIVLQATFCNLDLNNERIFSLEYGKYRTDLYESESRMVKLLIDFNESFNRRSYPSLRVNPS